MLSEQAIRRGRALRIRVWLAIASSIAACGVLVSMHYQEREILVRTQQAIENNREARIDLAKGFLHVAMSGERDSPYRREQGLALLNQAIATLAEGDLHGIAPDSNRLSVAREQFRADVAMFREQLAVWEQGGPSLKLRIAFHALDRQAGSIDIAGREELKALADRHSLLFQMTVGAVALLLAGVCVGVVLVSRREQAVAQTLRESEERLRQASKMEALGTLAGGIAHDFNNILTAVNGNARLALEELPAGHVARTSVEEIASGARRASELVRRILAFSRKEESVLRPIDMRTVVEEALRLLRATTPTSIDIRFVCDDELPRVMADPTEVHQIVMNLGANARDAMREHGGSLTIELRQAQADAHLAEVAPGLCKDEACVVLSVIDTGAGMSPETLERIFEPFFTTKAPGEGTGMGLAVVHGVVRRHHGFIRASSEPGRGTRFEVWLPTTQQPAVSPASTDAPAPAGHGERILYVDDDEALVQLATRMLTRRGFEADGRTDALRALQEFRENPARWEMVITDLGMPGVSGLDFAAELLKLRPDLPVVITSGYVRDEDAARARAIGAHDIVLKPNTVDELMSLIATRMSRAQVGEAVCDFVTPADAGAKKSGATGFPRPRE